jgi:D-alanine-D-alanine ligase
VNVLVIHTAVPSSLAEGRDAGEFDLTAAAQNVAAAIPDARVATVRGEVPELVRLLVEHEPDVVFNLCEAPLGRPDRETHAAALFEWMGLRFTGCGSETLMLCRRKPLVNAVLREAGLAVPATIDPRRPAFPCIVKPADEDGSWRIDDQSICQTPAALHAALSRLDEPRLVQDYIVGREFVVSLWGRSDPDHVAIGETVLAGGLRAATYASKWIVTSEDFARYTVRYDLDLEPSTREAIACVARRTWSAVGARHMLRVDIRVDAAGTPFVLDVNPNPEISPEVGICRAVEEAGWSWSDFVKALIEWA